MPEGKKKQETFIEKLLFYTTAFFILLGTFSLFAFLFLVPFIIDPAFTTIFMEFDERPAQCITTDVQSKKGEYDFCFSNHVYNLNVIKKQRFITEMLFLGFITFISHTIFYYLMYHVKSFKSIFEMMKKPLNAFKKNFWDVLDLLDINFWQFDSEFVKIHHLRRFSGSLIMKIMINVIGICRNSRMMILIFSIPCSNFFFSKYFFEKIGLSFPAKIYSIR